jgi:hypothetical protein
MICLIAFVYQGVSYLPGNNFDFESLDVEDRNEAFQRKHFVAPASEPVVLEVTDTKVAHKAPKKKSKEK